MGFITYCALTTYCVPCTVSAAAIGSSGDSSSLCQLSGSNTSTTELVPILLKDENGKLKGSALLSNCDSELFCVDGSNVTLPYRLVLAREFGHERADITFSPLPDGNITAVVTTDLGQLTAAIRQLSRRQFCCVDGVSQLSSVKCFLPELKCKPPLCVWLIDACLTCLRRTALHLSHSTHSYLCDHRYISGCCMPTYFYMPITIIDGEEDNL